MSVCRQVNVFSVQAVGGHNNLRVLKATTENHGSVFAAAPLCDQLTWTFANVLGNLHFWSNTADSVCRVKYRLYVCTIIVLIIQPTVLSSRSKSCFSCLFFLVDFQNLNLEITHVVIDFPESPIPCTQTSKNRTSKRFGFKVGKALTFIWF